MRCDRERGEFGHDRLLCAEPSLHRQCDPYGRRYAIAIGMRAHYAKQRAAGANWRGDDHAGLRIAKPIRAAHRRTCHIDGRSHTD